MNIVIDDLQHSVIHAGLEKSNATKSLRVQRVGLRICHV